jgi:drug/metabolite transporter (DMT)-like permease
VAAVAQAVGLVMSVPITLAVGWDRVTWLDVLWSVLSGVCVGIGLMWFYAAMAGGMFSLVAPAVGVIGALIPVGVAVGRGERPGLLATVGIAVALLAIAVVSLVPGESHTRPDPRTIFLTLGAGVSFGGFFAFYALPSADAGLWASPLSRVGSTVVLVTLALHLTRSVRVDPAGFRWILLLAAVEVTAAVALLYAFQRGPVAIASVLASLYPVTTVLLAGLVLRERLTTPQRLGVILALAATVLVSLE